MKASAFLLASQIVPSVTTKSRSTGGKAGAEEDMETEWVLCKASDVGVQGGTALMLDRHRR